MLTTHCPNCGNAVSLFAASCRRCGTPTPTRLGALAVVGSLLLLVVALGIAAFVVLRRDRIVGPPDFSWLTKAMDEGDVEAGRAPDTIHFLVIPLTSLPADDEGWRQKSLNDI